MIYLIDSSAWIDYLRGSELGKKVREILLEENEVYVISIIISEVVSKIKRDNGDVEIAYRSIISNSKIAEITPKISKEAGLLHADMKNKIKGFGLVDSLIISVAKKLNAKILTKDEHFKKFKEVVFLG